MNEDFSFRKQNKKLRFLIHHYENRYFKIKIKNKLM
jgi:hypothetical protein